MHSTIKITRTLLFHCSEETFSKALQRGSTKKKLLHQMSSGVGTQQNNSREEGTIADSMELSMMNQMSTSVNENIQHSETEIDREAFLQYQKSLLNRSPSYRKSIDRLSMDSIESNDKSGSDVNQTFGTNCCIVELENREAAINELKKMMRLPSDRSMNTLIPESELQPKSPMVPPPINLRDELLNCDQKELFQFLNEDPDNSNNYFSDTVGLGNTIEADTDSLILDDKKDNSIMSSNRKTSSSSIRSNLSYISNSIFQNWEQKRNSGSGRVSISDSIDKMFVKCDPNSKFTRNSEVIEDQEPLVKDPEFKTILRSFDKELDEIKRSTNSLNRNLSLRLTQNNESNCYENPLVRQSDSKGSIDTKPKRRSLEKQRKIDDGFHVSEEIRKICLNMQAPYSEINLSSKISPKMRRKSDFHTSFDRIKRTSLIERVDETSEEEKIATTGVKAESERLPRKSLILENANIDCISLKSTESYQNLINTRRKLNEVSIPIMDTMNLHTEEKDKTVGTDQEKLSTKLVKKDRHPGKIILSLNLPFDK